MAAEPSYTGRVVTAPIPDQPTTTFSAPASNVSFGWPVPGAFFPIAEYAFLSDREAMALVSPSGDVEWLCVPRPDGPSVFGAILDRAAGSFRVGPDELSVPAGRRYLPGTNVLETTWQTRSGWLLVRTALAVRRWSGEARDVDYVRPPDDFRADHVLVRTIKCINGQVDLEVRCEPVFGYGLRDADWTYTGPGYGEAAARGGEDDPELRLSTDLRLGLEGRTARAHTTMQQGDRAFVALSWGDGQPPGDVDEAAERLRLTADFWRGWVVSGDFPDHPWRPVLQRSALTLKGLTYAPTGALLAAPTTSLPETPGGERNWDYRYTWVRDGTWALWGLYTLELRERSSGLLPLHRGPDRRGRAAAGHVRRRWGTRAGGAYARSPFRLRGFDAGQGRERRVPATAERRLGGASRFRDAAPGRRRAPGRRDLDRGRADRGRGGVPLARAGPGDLGDALGSGPLHLVEDHVLGCLRQGGPPRRADGRAGDGDPLAHRGRCDPRGRPDGTGSMPEAS